MTFEDALAFLDNPKRYGASYEPDAIQTLLNHLGNPEQSMSLVHIVGTNGKGSVGALLCAMLKAAGVAGVGHFTSPHVRRFTERIRFNGKDIDEASFVRATIAVQQAMQKDADTDSLRAFPLQMIAALVAFRMKQVGIAVMEAGIGGGHDSINALPPSLVLVTPIGLDHTERLGATEAKIAREKAGVFRRGVPVISAPQIPSVREALIDCAERAGTEVVFIREEAVECYGSSFDRRFVWHSSRGSSALAPRLSGSKQGMNAALAGEALFALCPQANPEMAAKGASAAFLPGRQQAIGSNPVWVVDGGHNRQAVEALVREVTHPEETVAVVGMMADKTSRDLVDLWRSCCRKLLLVPVADARSWDPKAVKAKFFEDDASVEALENLSEAMDVAKDENPAVILIGGSLYLAGEALDRLEERGVYNEN